MPRKLRVGWFSFTCSEDSTIVFIELMNNSYFEWKKLIDFKYFKTLKGKNTMKGMDVAFVEGAIVGKNEEKRLKDIRKNCKKLIAIGNCACIGIPSNQRNFFDKKQLEEAEPIAKKFKLMDKVLAVPDIVKVDDKVPGCPMDQEKFLVVLGNLLKEFKIVA
jgi:coenzyme F420-reducing hydrogenase gamma subunit